MNIADIIGLTLGYVIVMSIYFGLGGLICPNSLNNQWARAGVVAFWPIVLIVSILLIPFGILYEFSKPIEKNSLINKINNL